MHANSFIRHMARLWNSLSECFPLTYDLIGFNSSFKSRFFLKRFLVSFNLFVLLFLVTSSGC